MQNKQSLNHKLIGLILLAIGVFFLYSARSLPEVPIKEEGFEAITQSAETPTRIQIPEVKIDLAIQSANLTNGYWEVFNDRAGWGAGTAAPGETGNMVIFAHARERLFLPLRWVKRGTKITISTQTKSYNYEISEIKVVKPSDVEVIRPTSDERLTLFTCSGFADRKRLIVVAKRV